MFTLTKSTCLIIFFKLITLLLATIPPYRRDIKHSTSELNKCSPNHQIMPKNFEFMLVLFFSKKIFHWDLHKPLYWYIQVGNIMEGEINELLFKQFNFSSSQNASWMTCKIEYLTFSLSSPRNDFKLCITSKNIFYIRKSQRKVEKNQQVHTIISFHKHLH